MNREPKPKIGKIVCTTKALAGRRAAPRGKDKMPSQLFRITRAPECPPVDENRLRYLLRRDRMDSEWTVDEVRVTGPDEPATPGQIVRVLHGEQKPVESNAVLSGNGERKETL